MLKLDDFCIWRKRAANNKKASETCKNMISSRKFWWIFVWRSCALPMAPRECPCQFFFAIVTQCNESINVWMKMADAGPCQAQLTSIRKTSNLHNADGDQKLSWRLEFKRGNVCQKSCVIIVKCVMAKQKCISDA